MRTYLRLNQSKQLIRNYKKQGNDDVSISEPDISRKDSETLIYNFKITPGIQYKISQLEFEGLSVFTKSQAIEIMDLAQTLRNRTVFTQEKIRQAILLLKKSYNESGYWDVNVGLPQVSKDPDTGSVVVRFNVIEGRRRVLESIKLEGAKNISLTEIRKFFNTQVGESLVWEQIVFMEDQIRNFYTNEGYLYAQTQIELVQTENIRDIKTKLVIKISEGKIVRFGKVDIEGLYKDGSFSCIKRDLL